MSSHMIDLDHNATTRPLPEVVETVARVMVDAYANPGSRHAAGRTARRVLEESRETVAAILNADPQGVVFTSGGTEATNLALLGFADRRRGVIVLPPAEHPATEETVRYLETWDFQRHTLPIDGDGRFSSGALDGIPWEKVIWGTALLAHNETGVVHDLRPLAEMCQVHGVPFHVDAVQAVGKMPVDFHALGAATMSAGAHKFHGPRGIGMLLVRDGVRLPAAMFGGRQEGGHRPGTESVALAAGMATALRLWHEHQVERTAHVLFLRDRLESALDERCPPVVIHGSPGPRLPNTLNIAFPGVDGDALLVALDLAGVCVSLGSACASGSSEPSPILIAMGVPRDVALSSLRLSVGIDNTREEIDAAIDRIASIVTRLRGS
ncbi:MAG: cysteine desulfurase [Planctomycetaceae bacterium]|nr:cysteine desulfurase [Planctomycetaceae bacterium]